MKRAKYKNYKVMYWRGQGKAHEIVVRGADTHIVSPEIDGGIFEIVDAAGKAMFTIPVASLIECIVDTLKPTETTITAPTAVLRHLRG